MILDDSYQLSYITDFNININTILNQKEKFISLNNEKVSFFKKYRTSGIIILSISIFTALILVLFNYNKIIINSLKEIKEEDIPKVQKYYNELLKNNDFRPKSKEEIKEELRKLSQNK